MVQVRMRPRLHREVDRSEAEVRLALTRGLGDPGAAIGGQSVPGHVDLWIGEPDRHAWSPWLSLELRGTDARTVVEGRFGPDPHVWTGFMAAYAVLLFGVVMGLMFGAAQAAAGEAATGLWGAAAALLGLGLTYAAALTGQALGHAQMDTLRAFLEARLSSESANSD